MRKTYHHQDRSHAVSGSTRSVMTDARLDQLQLHFRISFAACNILGGHLLIGYRIIATQVLRQLAVRYGLALVMADAAKFGNLSEGERGFVN